jgi:hypothetical protein
MQEYRVTLSAMLDNAGGVKGNTVKYMEIQRNIVKYRRIHGKI